MATETRGRPPVGASNPGRYARSVAMRGFDMPPLRTLEKAIPNFVQFVPRGRNGRNYRRFFVKSKRSAGFFHCYMKAEDRLNGLQPREHEVLNLFSMSDIKLNETTGEYEVTKTYTATARTVTYSAPDNTQVARMQLVFAEDK
jgi:hypothetical protein